MYFYITLISVLLLDTITKLSAQNYLTDTIFLVGNIVFLQYAENTGIAFSIHIPSLLLKIITIVLIITIFYYYKSEKKQFKNNHLYDIAFGCIIGGALGNAYERILYEKVIDFLGIRHFAIMNLADIFISLGAMLYLYVLYKNNKKISSS